ncbi:hypothetical protein M3Y97_00187100 [Aphelenchoides bicaudatus]|nr:hypothetical protein M3Y97_00187100 [Aphelenchoides bicaudatus]
MTFEHENPRYRFCGVHVHLLTLIVAIIAILLNIGTCIGNFKTHTYYYYSTGIISGICYVLLILGNRLESRILYWPFFVINTLVLIFMVIVAILLFVFAANIYQYTYDDWVYDDLTEIRTSAIVIGCVYLVSFIIQIVFMVIISRDYTYVRDMHYYPPPRVTPAVATPVVYAQQPVFAQQAPPPQVIHVVSEPCHDSHHHCDD